MISIYRKSARGILLSLALLVFASDTTRSVAAEAALKTKHVFLIMTDGLRWQEVFTGAEDQLMNRENGGVSNTNALRHDFWRETPDARRAALMPFFWQTLAKQGQLFGNTNKGSIAHVTNGKNFSYPGYSEIVTGIADPGITSNEKKPNPNISVLEWLNRQPKWHGKVAAFANWDVVPYILNRDRSQLPVWTGLERTTDSAKNPKQAELETLVEQTTPIWRDMTFDVFIQHAALHHLKTGKPEVMYITYGETDEWAHEGRYDLYLRSAHNVDRYIQALWEAAQAMPDYRNQTTFIITTDHGRGTSNTSWRNHGDKIPEAGFIWVAVMGPDTPPLGERENTATVTQNQIAATLAKFLSEDYPAAFPQVGAPIAEVFPKAAK